MIENVAVVGLGSVGLPLAAAFANSKVTTVLGVDTDDGRLDAIRTGEAHGNPLSPKGLRGLVKTRKLRVSSDFATLRDAEAIIICLPTPLNEHKEPDLSAVVLGTRRIASYMRREALVVLESTTYPGTTREVLLPILEEGGRVAGEDFFLAFSPERFDPGNRHYTVRNTPRIISGVTAECTRRANSLYAKVVDRIYEVSKLEVAEMTKLLENTFRSVNIALVNEIAILCHRMGVDVWEVIDAAETKPFGFMPFYPGPGLGGHCIPIDPYYLSWKAHTFDMSAELVELASRININMPYYAMSRISAALNAAKKQVNGSRVLLLGVSYKPNIEDLRESPALTILQLLRYSGADVRYHDPHVPDLSYHGLSTVEATREEFQAADCVVVVTDHDAMDLSLMVESSPLVIDLCNAIRRRLGKLPPHVEVL